VDASRSLSKKKAAIYTRVSTQWQIDKDSLQVQRRELIAFADLVLGITDYEVFVDPGYSAKNTDRPDYQRMMERLRTGEFSHLLVWKIDRISRNLLDFANMHAELKSLGVAFVSKNEQFDTSTAMGEAMVKIILVFAELERQVTAERVTAIMLSRADSGKWNGGRVPYGYNYDTEEKCFTLNQYEHRIYLSMCDKYEETNSLLATAKWLNSNGYRTRQGLEWSPVAINKILRNVWYIGSYKYNVHSDGKGVAKRDEAEWIVIENHHLPALSEARFERIQLSLTRNRRGGIKVGTARMNKNIHIFAGLITCGECGHNMSATLDRRRADGWRPSIYSCYKRRLDKSCGNKYISDIIIGPFVFNFIANIMQCREKINPKTPLPVLAKKVLKGSPFLGVAICDEDLVKLKKMILSTVSGVEFKPEDVFAGTEKQENKLDILEERRRKTEIALNRLKSIFLFGEDAMSEAEYIIERKKLLDELEETNKGISELKQNDEEAALSEDDFLRKASYFVMAEKLLNERFVDYEKYIRGIDPQIPRMFIRSVIKNIEATGGKITSLQFSNDVTIRFVYS